VLTKLLGFGSQERFQQFFFQHPLKSFGWGLITTAAIRSSSVTTSLVVPWWQKNSQTKKSGALHFGRQHWHHHYGVYRGHVQLQHRHQHCHRPFSLQFYRCTHFLFIPIVKDIPIELASRLGRLTLKYRLVGFLYVILMFFFIPFSLIYLNKDAVSIRELTYEKQNYKTQDREYYKIITKTYKNQAVSSWSIYDESENSQDPSKIISVYRKETPCLLTTNSLS